MVSKKYICPECNAEFKTRKPANEHRREKNHKGAIMVEMVETKPKITTSLPRKGNYKCPQCPKTSKALKGMQDHMKAKGHKGNPSLEEPKSKSKINKKPIVKVEPKPEPKAEPKLPIMAFMKIYEEAALKIMPLLNEGLEESMEKMSILVNPQNGGYLLQYYSTITGSLDYLQFKYQFFNIEMDNSDVLFCLNILKGASNTFRVWDMAGLKMYGTSEFADGNIMISLDDSERAGWEVFVEGLSASTPDELACVSGIWKKTYSPPKPVKQPISPTPPKPALATIPAKQEVQKQLPLKEGKIVQGPIESFEDWDISMWASESFESYMGGRVNQSFGVRNPYPNYKPPPPPAPPKPISYPVYGVTQYVFIIDRIISFESNE